jgi:hypothetical protein
MGDRVPKHVCAYIAKVGAKQTDTADDTIPKIDADR